MPSIKKSSKKLQKATEAQTPKFVSYFDPPYDKYKANRRRRVGTPASPGSGLGRFEFVGDAWPLDRFYFGGQFYEVTGLW